MCLSYIKPVEHNTQDKISQKLPFWCWAGGFGKGRQSHLESRREPWRVSLGVNYFSSFWWHQVMSNFWIARGFHSHSWQMHKLVTELEPQTQEGCRMTHQQCFPRHRRRSPERGALWSPYGVSRNRGLEKWAGLSWERQPHPQASDHKMSLCSREEAAGCLEVIHNVCKSNFILKTHTSSLKA